MGYGFKEKGRGEWGAKRLGYEGGEGWGWGLRKQKQRL